MRDSLTTVPVILFAAAAWLVGHPLVIVALFTVVGVYFVLLMAASSEPQEHQLAEIARLMEKIADTSETQADSLGDIKNELSSIRNAIEELQEDRKIAMDDARERGE